MTIGLTTLLVLAGLWGAAFTLAAMTPAWYRPISADNTIAEADSERIEFRIQQELQRIRMDPGWTLRLPDNVANAWLATRLPQWLQGQGIDWPNGVGTPQVRIRSGVIEVAAPVDDLNGRIGRLDLVPQVTAHGLRLVPTTARVGRLPIGLPAHRVLGDLDGLALLHRPVPRLMDLIDARHVVLMDIRPKDGAIELLFETRSGPVP
jgi:hypothetical protein